MTDDKADKSRVALTIQAGDQTRDVTYDELVLSNNLSQEALARLLIEKKIFEPKELLDMMEKVRKERYRTSDTASS
ncbi:MAG: hypothetical protein IIB00_04865 [candidate division Zixibacteria bacterium]|nr:hypothetical protein [candidate division Zixibacteria bacterium]